MVEMDPYRRIEVIIDQLRKDILYGPLDIDFKKRQLKKFKERATELLHDCDDFDRQRIEDAFPLTEEEEEWL